MKNKIEMLAGPIPSAIIISATIIAIALIINSSDPRNFDKEPVGKSTVNAAPIDPVVQEMEELVIPTGGVAIPVVWGTMGQNLIKAGVIKADEFKKIYESRGTYTPEVRELLEGTSTEKLVVTQQNAGILLNLFWALGLAQKSSVLEEGEMTNPRYGGAQNFASTGGWTLSQGKAMEHYSYHTFFLLTSEQQAVVEKVSRGIYRPCCGNSVHFPDCNHGMAMLGLLELMASQGASEQEMWDTALAVNSYWFPDTYVTIGLYMKDRGVKWNEVDPRVVLGSDYSSSSGFARITSKVTIPNVQQRGAGGCGVNTEQSAPVPVSPTRQQGGCGI